jgi:hypothetical protein
MSAEMSDEHGDIRRDTEENIIVKNEKHDTE